MGRTIEVRWWWMNVLVTGGAGYIGSAAVDRLADEGYGVVSIDNLSRGDYGYLVKYRESSRVKLAVGDICDLKELEGVLSEGEGVDAVVHMAAVPGIEMCQRSPREAVLTNVYGTHNVLEVARKYDVSKVVFASSAAVYGDPVKTPIGEDHPLIPTNLYGVTKLAAERLLESYHMGYGMDTVILRFGNVYGVGAYTHWDTVIPKFVRQALNGQALTIYGDGEQGRDFIHVWDAVEAVVLALKSEKGLVAGESFNVGVGKGTSVNSIADTVSKVFLSEYGKKVDTVSLPPRSGEARVPNFCYSIAKIRGKLGFNPEWYIEKHVKQLIEYGMENL
jgi:UDP-glucose 4-epimerase